MPSAKNSKNKSTWRQSLPPREYKIRINDMIKSISLIFQYTKDLNFETFSKDQKTIDAVLRNFEIIGEAAKHVPEEIKTKYQDIEWKNVAAMRDFLAHEYFGISIKIIWDTIHKDLNILDAKLKNIL